ncbi:HAD family hydrolase [Caulobacter segnis]|uniref:D-glycero-alpha-D-manno-heptose-1,7-bisphosphate 7-phosphatase n=1 Tax=Caulobacter segnis TaxID=88688 RepID=UPI0028581C1B|nr:HAD family hydrolase [Caulobacter segnis]MDR6624944.1 D-glycero-D-manno-heptose 1,7-bisphosphate phosphatase [Caulobacter segnis]
MIDRPVLRAVFFDRDGVINVDHGYVHDPKALEWVEGAREILAELTKAGVKVLVVTNQSGVARGYFDEAAVDGFHAAIQAGLSEAGAKVDAFYSCPYHESALIERYRHPDHPDRKPNPGMILRGLADWALRPEEACMVGDKASDVEAANRAGMEGYLYTGGDLAAFLRSKIVARFHIQGFETFGEIRRSTS